VEATQQVQQSTRVMVVAGGVLLALIVVTAVLVFVAERRTPPSYPPGSPEAAVVAYIEAVRSGDRERVLALLSSRVRTEIRQREEREPFYDFDAELRAASDSLRNARLRIVRVDLQGDRALVRVAVERDEPSLQPGFPLPVIGGGSFAYERTLQLVREGGEWKIDEVALYL